MNLKNFLVIFLTVVLMSCQDPDVPQLHTVEIYATTDAISFSIQSSIDGVDVDDSTAQPPFYRKVDVESGAAIYVIVTPLSGGDLVSANVSVDGQIIAGQGRTGSPITISTSANKSTYDQTSRVVELYATSTSALMDISYCVGGQPIHLSSISSPFYYTKSAVNGTSVLLRIVPGSIGDHATGTIAVDGKTVGLSGVTGKPVSRLDTVATSTLPNGSYTIALSATTDGASFDLFYVVGGMPIALSNVSSPWSYTTASVGYGTPILFRIIPSSVSDHITAEVRSDGNLIASQGQTGQVIDISTFATP